MDKLVVLGASLAQIPFVITAKSMGCYVAIVDYDQDAPAIKYADEYFKCSLLDVNRLLAIVKDFQPDGITCGASDIGVLSAAKLCKELGLPSISVETAIRVKNKDEMIKSFETNNVAHPRYVVVDKVNDRINLEFPVVVKPVDNSGSRGINVAHSEEELVKAFLNSFSYSKMGRVIVEEYLEGPEVSVELLVQNGEPFALQVTDKITSGEPHFIEIGHSQPSQLPVDKVNCIKKLAYDAVKAVGIKDGCAHAEIKLTAQGPKMVEIAGRLGGDFITTILLPKSTGINISEYEILRALGKPKHFDSSSINRNECVAIRFFQAKSGKLKSVRLDYSSEELCGIEEIKIECMSGIIYGEAESNNDRFGYVVATGKTTQIALDRCKKVVQRINIEME